MQSFIHLSSETSADLHTDCSFSISQNWPGWADSCAGRTKQVVATKKRLHECLNRKQKHVTVLKALAVISMRWDVSVAVTTKLHQTCNSWHGIVQRDDGPCLLSVPFSLCISACFSLPLSMSVSLHLCVSVCGEQKREMQLRLQRRSHCQFCSSQPADNLCQGGAHFTLKQVESWKWCNAWKQK